jgi:S-adenosylmethionine-diacylglycerol 3-amino-3-carboxypropyl transferase
MFFSRPFISWFDPDRHFLGQGAIDLHDHVLESTRRALVDQDPSRNPYLRWILTGSFGDTLPFALRPENFSLIRDNLDRLEWRCGPLGDLLLELGLGSIDRMDLGIQVEHLRPSAYHALLDRLMRTGRRGGRIIHWNLLVPRSRPPEIDACLRPLRALSQRLSAEDHSFYHHSVVVEEITDSSFSSPSSFGVRP